VQEKLTRFLKAKELLKEMTGHEQGSRRKWGIFNFIGELSKV
jgi:hypothetical protein